MTVCVRRSLLAVTKVAHEFSGGLDPRKHSSPQECAEQELSEEARLAGGTYTRLVPCHHPGISEVKWSANRCTPFLVVNPHKDPHPGERDAEEHIEVVPSSVGHLVQFMHITQSLI
jgi:hypothetical protein